MGKNPNPKNEELTTSEKDLIGVYKAYTARHNSEPSIRHLARVLNKYPNSVRHTLKSLKDKGYIREAKITMTRMVLSAKAKKVET